jgi:large subunit ribosomal protein L15
MSGKYQLKKPESVKTRKRVGRGTGSGNGKTSGRGQKGQMSRAGATMRAWFEGGQMPLQRRIPKRGFNNRNFRKEYQIVNLGSIGALELSEVTPQVLKERGLIGDSGKLIKVLSKGEISKSCKVTADSFSKSAEEKIKKSGGETIVREKAS